MGAARWGALIAGYRFAVGAAPITRSLLLVTSLSAGAWKILDLRTANVELDRRSRACESAVAEVQRAVREARSSRLRRGEPAPGFTLPGLDGDWVRLEPGEEKGAVHLLFLDPWGLEGDGAPAAGVLHSLLESYRSAFSRRVARARALVLTPAGPEVAVARLGGVKPPEAVAVHAWAAYRAFGVLDSPALVVVEGGRVRERWSLPVRGDELLLD